MAYCSAGDLSQFIRKKGQVQGLNPLPPNGREKYPHPKEGGLNATVVRCFLGQLAEALKFLRDQNIIHRDIKPQVGTCLCQAICLLILTETCFLFRCLLTPTLPVMRLIYRTFSFTLPPAPMSRLAILIFPSRCSAWQTLVLLGHCRNRV